MSEKITKKIIVFDGILSMKSNSLNEIESIVNEVHKSIPENYRDTAHWSMGNVTSLGEANVIISYKRLETDEENAERDKHDGERVEKSKDEKIRRAILLAKEYPGILQVSPEIEKKMAKNVK